jgi:hypothetical protein
MYDSLTHLMALAHEAELRRNAARPDRQVLHSLPRTRRRPRWLAGTTS